MIRKSIYISNLDSALGYHIAQYYRDDHLELNPQTRIVGTAAHKRQLNGVHALIDVKKV